MSEIVLFDYGGVVARHHCDPAEQVLCATLMCTREQLRAELSERSRLGAQFRMAKISEAAFWDGISKRLGVPSDMQPPAKYLSRLWAYTYEPRSDVIEILRDLRHRGAVLGVVTNIDVAREAYMHRTLRSLVGIDVVFSSHKLGATKYQTRFWREIRRAILLQFAGIVSVTYIDDRASHVASARAIGWVGHKFSTPSRLRAALRV